MPNVLATVHLPYTTGLPSDEAVNTFAFIDDTVGGATSEITDVLVDFYTTNYPTLNLGQYISAVVDRTSNACRVDLAEIVDAGPTVDVGPVYYSDTFTLDAPGAAPDLTLPLEVAVCASFRADGGSAPIARRRGRVYLGPLEGNASIEMDTANYPTVSPDLTSLIAEASEALQVASTLADVPWAVWSRRDGVLRPVTSGWVNNEFDTQRRRQVDATLRDNWSVLI